MKVIKLKNNYKIDISNIVYNRTLLKDLINGKVIYDGYIVQGESIQIGSLREYRKIDIIVYANGCYGFLSLPIENLGEFGIVWNACDNRLAHYYVAGYLNIEGNVSVKFSGYFRSDTNTDYERNYGIKKIIAYM